MHVNSNEYQIYYIFDTGLSKGVLCKLSCPLVRPSVGQSVFGYLRDRPLVLSNCLEARAYPVIFRSGYTFEILLHKFKSNVRSNICKHN